MALLFMDGFDAGDFEQKWAVYDVASYVQGDTTTRFGAGRSIVISRSATHSYVEHAFTPIATAYVGFAMMMTNYNSAYGFVLLKGDDGLTSHLSLRAMTSTTMGLYRGTTQVTTFTVPPITTWHYYEISATIDDASGTCEVRVDGVTCLDFTGDTRNGGTATTIDGLQISGINNLTDVAIYFDDLYICDSTGSTNNTFLGDVRVQTLVPTGAGTTTQMTPSTGANWETVDELPYSATDYVTGTSGQVDTYQTSDVSASTGTIFGVQANVVARKTDAGDLSGRTVVKSGSTTSNGATTALGTTDVTISTPLELDPDTSSSWTTTGVNGIEIGTEAV